MNDAGGSEDTTSDGVAIAGNIAPRRPVRRAFCASCETTFDVQDAPRAWATSNSLLAMTRWASPNRLNSCASFLARPL